LRLEKELEKETLAYRAQKLPDRVKPNNISGDKELLKEASGDGYNVMTFKEFESISPNR